MNKKYKSHHFRENFSEVGIFIHCVGIGSFIALFLGYFLLGKIVTTNVRFFLCWTCVSILAVIVGIYFQTLSDPWTSLIYYIAAPFILVAISVQSLVMTYLFATHQPSPDQMSRIYTLSWILVIAVIHTMWALSGESHPLYGPISKSLGTDASMFSFLVLILSALITIGLWITIALFLAEKDGSIMDTNTKFFFQWTGMSMLTLTMGFILISVIDDIRKRTLTPINIIDIIATNILFSAIYLLHTPFLVVFIIQGLAMTYFFATMQQPDPGQMSQIHVLSWILFVTATSMFYGAAHKLPSGDSDSDTDNQPRKFPRPIAIISTLSTIGLWITIATLMVRQ